MRGEDRDFKNEPIEWRELKEFIVGQVKRAGRRIDTSYVKDVIREGGGNVDNVLRKLEEKGYLGPSVPRPPAAARPTSTHLRAEERRRNLEPKREGSLFDHFRRYRRRIQKRVERGFTGLRVHATAFAGVNIFLFVLWILTGAGHPWFLYPLGAWGIGLLNHINPVYQRLRQRREVESLPDLSREETGLLKRFHRSRTGFAAHFASTAGLSAFLMMIDVITGGFFPWSLIPTGVLGFGLLLHWSAYAPRARRLRRRIGGWISEGSTGGSVESGRGSGIEARARVDHPRVGQNEPAIVHEAAELRSSILHQIEEMEKDHPNIGADMRPLLDTYFEQVSQLANKALEIDMLLDQVPVVDLEGDRARLKNRMDNVESDRLRTEYEKSILQVDKQLASVKELSHHSEMLDLRLSSAVNLMKQLQLDLARVKGASLTSSSSVGLLKDKSDELSEYLKDLESGYDELESDL